MINFEIDYYNLNDFDYFNTLADASIRFDVVDLQISPTDSLETMQKA